MKQHCCSSINTFFGTLVYPLSTRYFNRHSMKPSRIKLPMAVECLNNFKHVIKKCVI
jgi:hypothetical protein